MYPRVASLPVERDEATRRVGSALTAALAEAGKSQTWLAGILGASQAAVSTWCRGEALPTVAQLVAIDGAFGWPRGRLLRRSGIIEPLPLVEAIALDPGLDDEARAQMHAMYDELAIQTARRRTSLSNVYADVTAEMPVPSAADVAAAMNERSELAATISAAVVEALTRTPLRGARPAS